MTLPRYASCIRGANDWDQAFSDGIDAKAESFEGLRAEQRRNPMFAEDDAGRGLAAVVDRLRPAHTTQTSPSIGKDSGPFIEVGDSQRIEHI